MARASFRDVVLDSNGLPIQNVDVTVYEPGTTTKITETIYDSYSGVGTLSNPFTTNAQGEVQFYLDAPKTVDVLYEASGFDAETHTVHLVPDDVTKLYEDFGEMSSFTKAGLPTTGVKAGDLSRVTDDVRGLWMYQGSQWFSLSGNVVLATEFGCVADATSADGSGATDNGPFLQDAIDAITEGVIYVPKDPDGNGYYFSTGVQPKDNVWIVSDGALFYNDATQPSGLDSAIASKSWLFALNDLKNVTVRGLRVTANATGDFTGGRNPQVAVGMAGTIENVTCEGLVLLDHQNFALMYGDTDTTFASANFDGIYLNRIRIDGDTGPTGDGSGINIFCRSQDGTTPGGRNLYLDSIFIDVTRGNADESEHGPQGLKVNNCRGVYGAKVACTGGDTAAAILTNGVQDAHLTNVKTYRSNRGLQIDDSNNVATTRTEGVTVHGLSYDPEDVTSGGGSAQEYGLVLGHVEDATVTLGSLKGQIRFIDSGEGRTASAIDISGGKAEGNLIVQDPGVAISAITGLHLHDMEFVGGAGTLQGRVNVDSSNWVINRSHFHNLTFRSHDGTAIRHRGDDCRFADIISIDGNPDNDAGVALFFDDGARNSYTGPTLAGTSNVKWFYRANGASGAVLEGPLQGTADTAVLDTINGTETVLVRAEGSGSPEGSVVGRIGSIWSRTDGGAGTTVYVKESGTGNTGWKASVGNSGTDTQSGDGTTTSFTIAHGLGVSPEVATVTPGSSDANGAYHITVDATNITVTYASAPASGTNNLTWFWRAEA